MLSALTTADRLRHGGNPVAGDFCFRFTWCFIGRAGETRAYSRNGLLDSLFLCVVALFLLYFCRVFAIIEAWPGGTEPPERETEMATYYRISWDDDSEAALLNPDRKSALWGNSNRADGAPRLGVSVCESLSDLVDYFAARNCDWDEDAGICVLVELEGTIASDEDHDAGADGDPVLVIPTAVLSMAPLEDSDIIDELTS